VTSYADAQTLWLNVTNIALGLFCAYLMVSVATAAAQDVFERRRKRRRTRFL